MDNLKNKLKKNIIVFEKFKDAFENPFFFLDNEKSECNEYTYDKICLTLFNSKMKSEKIDMSETKIPRDILKVFWYKEGKNDEEPWYFIGKIKCKDKNKYVYYQAWCDYTGFDCQGGMKMYVSRSLTKILSMAIESDVLDILNKELN
jgi:hypothetical protein